MATLVLPYSFVNGTQIVASEMNSNFQTVKTFVESLSVAANIEDNTIAANKLTAAAQQLLAPTASVTQYAGSVAPTGWLLCDGAAVSRATYAALFAVIGTTYGAGDGSTTFNLPDLKGRVPVGRDGSQTEFDVLGETGGAKTVALAEANLPSHQHGVGTLTTTNTSVNHQHGVGSYGANSGGSHSHTIFINDPGHRHELSSTARQQGGGAANVFSVTDYNGFWSGYSSSVGTGITASADTHGGHGHTIGGASAFADPVHAHSVTGSTGPIGSGTAHNNLQPYLVMNYIIKI